MENGLACLATKLIAFSADEEIAEKQAPPSQGVKGAARLAAFLAKRVKTRKHSLMSFAQYLPSSSTMRAVLSKATNTYKPAVLRAKRAASSTSSSAQFTAT